MDLSVGSTSAASDVDGMKMEFPGPPPVYGHGFDPPEPSRIKCEVESSSDDEQVDELEGGCSRTMPEAWRLKWKKSTAKANPIPVGIAVARQRTEKQPTAETPTQAKVELFNPANSANYGYPPANWAWSNSIESYNAALWSPSTAYSTFPTHPAAAGHPPFLLIPCLDPYQRHAMLWPSYPTVPAQSPWALAPEMPTAPSPSWSLHPAPRSAFELPILRADEADAKFDYSDVKEERVSPQANEQAIRSPSPVETAPVATPAADYSGLQLLSDSIERFVSTEKKEDARPSNNALDVLCAAALYQDVPATPVSTAGFQEFDFRTKLAELQRKYKEKQTELSNLKCKKKDKSKKKKRKSSCSSKEDKASRRSSSSSSSRDGSSAPKVAVDVIVPGRLELPTRRPTGEEVKVELERIPTSYAAALVSAASVTTTQPSSIAEKKKRKPDCPVRKQEAECTETIVPNKKRKFFQLFQWCHSAAAASDQTPNAKKSKNSTDTSVRPKFKPKLKAEVQVKRIGTSSGEESEEEVVVLDERLEQHCLPALQFLQLNDPPEPEEVPAPPVVVDEPKRTAWSLNQDSLLDGLRVLITEEGLLHGGAVTGICPPDIYGVIVDGERGSRPRILSTEELLNEALLEIRPLGLDQLPVGTRVCAYWSRKSRCLYPGVVSNLNPAVPATGHRQVTREDEIDVEFDDGDSGRMPISQIRILPPDYPVIERDPNPLETLEGRRYKRRISESVAPNDTEQGDEVAKKKKKSSCDESNKRTDSSKKSKKSKKKKREQPDLIIPVSPGVDHAVAEEEDTPTKRETRASKEAVNSGADPAEEQRKTKSKMAAFLPERQLWQWLGGSFKKASKGKGRKEFYKAIHRGDEIIRVGDCAVFLSAGRNDRPYVGRIELLWQSWGGSMTVKVRWFYHPEETCGGRRLAHLKTAGALFESNHADENDVQTISHCCTVSSLEEYQLLCGGKPDVNLNLESAGTGHDQFYLAGFYDPTSGHLSFEPDVLEQQT